MPHPHMWPQTAGCAQTLSAGCPSPRQPCPTAGTVRCWWLQHSDRLQDVSRGVRRAHSSAGMSQAAMSALHLYTHAGYAASCIVTTCLLDCLVDSQHELTRLTLAGTKVLCTYPCLQSRPSCAWVATSASCSALQQGPVDNKNVCGNSQQASTGMRGVRVKTSICC